MKKTGLSLYYICISIKNKLFFMNHLSLSHYFWNQHLNLGDIAIDATCGAGNDTLVLAKACLSEKEGHVYGIDIQKMAIERTEALLETSLSIGTRDRISLIHKSHAPLPIEVPPANLIIYNLGYLPGSDRSIMTLSPTTIASLESAIERLLPEGMISIMLYPGHHEGLFETQTILNWASALADHQYSLSHHYRPNCSKAPNLLLIKKRP